ncbi:hypothetical protein [Microbacterium sp. P04]|uniref:hypothetical protein n=1 Tax=Microbacterium sp. P04 TaxID=3366947 RepID=UPI003746DB07
MPRPKSPCGTYPAYQRHLRDKSPVDAACREAQRQHDTGRGRTLRDRVDQRPPAAAPPSSPSKLVTLMRRKVDVRARYLELVDTLTTAAADDHLYDVIDTTAELGELLDEWCDVEDDIEHDLGYPDLPADLRDRLLAAWS